MVIKSVPRVFDELVARALVRHNFAQFTGAVKTTPEGESVLWTMTFGGDGVEGLPVAMYVRGEFLYAFAPVRATRPANDVDVLRALLEVMTRVPLARPVPDPGINFAPETLWWLRAECPLDADEPVLPPRVVMVAIQSVAGAARYLLTTHGDLFTKEKPAQVPIIHFEFDSD